MNYKKTKFVSVTFLSIATTLLLANCAWANTVSGKIKVLDDTNKIALTEFEITKKTTDQSVTGSLSWETENGDTDNYIEIKYVNIDGQYAWFAGKCTQSTEEMADRWLFIAVHDGGTPGNLVDHIWCQWLDSGPDAESIAKEKVENLEKPTNNKPIKSGNIEVICQN